MRRRVARILLAAVAALALVSIWRSDHLLFVAPGELASKAAGHVGRGLRKGRDVKFYMAFDEPELREWIGRGKVVAPGTEVRRGRHGDARYLNGGKHTYVSTEVPWRNLGDSYTMAVWVRLEEMPHPQHIWYCDFASRASGFALKDGKMTFSVPDGKGGAAVASYPFNQYGRFVHLAAVAEGPGGKVRLYENGAQRAEAEIKRISLPPHNMEFGKLRWYAVTEPMRGCIDEAIAWSRALKRREIARLARTSLSIPARKAPVRYALWRLVDPPRNAGPRTLKILDQFKPWMSVHARLVKELPEMHFYFSDRDSRHFILAHSRSSRAGRRVNAAAKPREVSMLCEGEVVRAMLTLDGSDVKYSNGSRASYLLELPEDKPFMGVTSLRLYPPEILGDNLEPLLAALSGRSRVNSVVGFCRLSVNGRGKGIYVFESYDNCAATLGQAPPAVGAELHIADWSNEFRDDSGNNMAARSVHFADGAPARLESVRRLLIRDSAHPWSNREWSWRLANFGRQLGEAAERQTVDAFDLLGKNPAPAFVRTDLDLTVLERHGLAFRSLRPELISNSGIVSRPEGDVPQDVEVLVLDRSSGVSAETDGEAVARLRLRVMPRGRRLGALMIYVSESFAYTRRVDFRARYYPADESESPCLLTGGQASNGGIKHRGNTSYWRGRKKSFSLRMDQPQEILGSNPSRYLYLLNGYVDHTKLRNKLVYDLFRAWGDGDQIKRYAPEVDWCEVFVNGVYYGIYEMCTRIDGEMLGYAGHLPEEDAVLYKMRPDANLFAAPETAFFNQIYPSRKRTSSSQSLHDLLRFTSVSDSATFTQQVGQWVDIRNAVDFMLMLNFSGNIDGRTTNFYLTRGGEEGALFNFILWDYDHTFSGRFLWLSNHLLDRLARDIPEFQPGLRRRWRELRTGVMSTESIDARITEMAERLQSSMPWEYAVVAESGAELPDYKKNVDELRTAVRTNLEGMDKRLGIKE